MFCTGIPGTQLCETQTVVNCATQCVRVCSVAPHWQVQYSLLSSGAAQADTKAAADDLGIVLIAYSPLALGLLTGQKFFKTANQVDLNHVSLLCSSTIKA